MANSRAHSPMSRVAATEHCHYSRAHSPMSHGAMTERLNRDHEPHMAERVESRIHLAAKQDVARVPRSLLEHCQARAAAAEKELRASDLGSTIGSARSEQ